MLLVTRPREQARDWVLRLQAAGVPAAAVPLLGIMAADTAADRAALEQAWAQLPHCRAVMFVSPNAVSGFFDAAPPSAATADVAPPRSWPAHTWAVAPGPGTAAALQGQGLAAVQIVQPPADAPQFDSESLWPALATQNWAGQDVLVVRGEGGREWLIQRWRQAGARVHTVVAYRRGAPALQESEVQHLRWAVAHPQQALWLWSSSEALEHLAPLVQAHAPEALGAGWMAQVRGLATHERIVEHARALGFSQVVACRADLPSVVAAYNEPHRDT
jgi:uroporphyrinogen-III synthase